MSQKSEEPTPRRLRRAQAEGDSGSSSYAAHALAFFASLAVAPAVAHAAIDWATHALRDAIGSAARVSVGASGFVAGLDAWTLARPVLELSVPLLAVTGATAIV